MVDLTANNGFVTFCLPSERIYFIHANRFLQNDKVAVKRSFAELILTAFLSNSINYIFSDAEKPNSLSFENVLLKFKNKFKSA